MRRNEGANINDSQIPSPPPRGVGIAWELRSLGLSTSEIRCPNFEIARAHNELRRKGNKMVRSEETEVRGKTFKLLFLTATVKIAFSEIRSSSDR